MLFILLNQHNISEMEEDKKKPKILVVEDDPGLRRTLSDILKAKGYSSLVVLTGKEGVAVAKKDDFSLALIGLKLSDIPGIEVLKEIKKSSPRTEVIILTAFASLDTAMEAVNLGAFSYLQKPYDMERLLLDIRRALEQKWTEEALRKSEEKYFNLYENANDIIYSHDLKGRFTSANRAARTAFGYRKEEVSKLTISGVLLPDDAILARQIVQRMVALKSDLKEQQPWEFKAVRKDGSILDIEVRSRLLKENGRIKGVQGIARDITERKKAEEALRESEEKYRTLITNIPDVTWTTDCNGNTIFISPNVERVYGYTPEEIYNAGNRIWFGRIHPDDIEKVKEAYAALFEKETKFDIVYRIKRKDGKWIWLHDKAVTTYVKDDVSYADGMFGDITERKRVEEELKNA
ncbi:MAG: PAS domain S-box protein, partial [Methanophagales archaeon]|nr:PAS domain S-box protein [Methanophagales archaeon]